MLSTPHYMSDLFICLWLAATKAQPQCNNKTIRRQSHLDLRGRHHGLQRLRSGCQHLTAGSGAHDVHQQLHAPMPAVERYRQHHS